MKDSKPNLFIVGAAKAGTTSLYNYLDQHPEIYMSPIKEPHYFGKDIQWENFEAGYKKDTQLDIQNYLENRPLKKIHLGYLNKEMDYLSLFRDGKNFKILGESSTSYLFSEHAAKEIHDFNEHAKIIMLLRNPVERTLSHYFMDVSSGVRQTNKDILQGLQKDYTAREKGWGISHLYIELSLYYNQVKRYADIFEKDQVLILKYEDLCNQPERLLKKIFSFLELSYPDKDISFDTTFNKTLIPKNQLVNKLKFLKKILPLSFSKNLKSKAGFLYKTSKEMEVKPEVKEYINEIVSGDWEKTKAFINYNI